MSYSFHKDPKPRGASWPVRRSRLDAAVDDAGAMGMVAVVDDWLGADWRSEAPRPLRLPSHGERAGGFPAGRVAITVCGGHSPLRREADTQMMALGGREQGVSVRAAARSMALRADARHPSAGV